MNPTYFEFATPQRKICTNEDMYEAYLSRHIKYTNCYRSLYKFERLSKTTGITTGYETALVDKLYFDFDSEHAQEKMIDMHEHLLRHKVLHHVRITGRGYALYVECEPYTSSNIIDTVYNAQYVLATECRFKLDTTAVDSDLDLSAFGNVSRPTRIIGTFNFNLYKDTKQKVFCTSLPHNMLYVPIEDVRKYASKQRFDIHTFGSKRIYLPKYDYPATSFVSSGTNINVNLGSIKTDSIPKESLLPCIIAIMNKRNPSQMERVALVAELSHILRLGGIIKKDKTLIETITKIILDCNWRDRNPRITKRQVAYTVNKQDNVFSCRWKRKHHMCIKER